MLPEVTKYVNFFQEPSRSVPTTTTTTTTPAQAPTSGGGGGSSTTPGGLGGTSLNVHSAGGGRRPVKVKLSIIIQSVSDI